MTANTQVANIQAQTAATTAVSPPSLHTLASQTGNVPLTRVALAFVDKRINLYWFDPEDGFGWAIKTIDGIGQSIELHKG